MRRFLIQDRSLFRFVVLYLLMELGMTLLESVPDLKSVSFRERGNSCVRLRYPLHEYPNSSLHRIVELTLPDRSLSPWHAIEDLDTLRRIYVYLSAFPLRPYI